MFKADIKEPIVPVKIHSRGLCGHESFLRYIVGNIGRVLKIDLVTLQVTFAMAATVTVEVDLRSSLPDRIWIGVDRDGFLAAN